MLLILVSFVLWLSRPALAAMQDLTHCDPSQKDEHCPPDPGFAASTVFDFTSASWDDSFEDFWRVDEGSSKDQRRIDFDTDGKGAALGMWEASQAPTLTSTKYLFFGKVTVEVQAAPGRGVITALVLKSDSGDEIDWEILGAYEKQAQTNYFHDGDALFNTYNTTYGVDSSVTSEFHTYSIEWTETKIVVSIDGENQKTWYVGEIPPDRWPQTPMVVKIGTWAVHEDSDMGEIQWAGGLPDWDKAPFKAYYRKVEVEDYTGHCKEVEGPVEYTYDERMGGWEDVKVSGCRTRLAPGMYTPHAPSGATQLTETGYPEPSGGAPGVSGSDGVAQPTAETGEPTGEAVPPQETREDDEEDEEGEATLPKPAFFTLSSVLLFGGALLL